MRRYLFSITTAGLLIAGAAFAQTATTTPPARPNVSFPIAELGNCGSKEECKAYCDVAEHKEACFTFAEGHGLMTKVQTAAARQIVKRLGPGGCSSAEECKAYCSDETHRDECYTFAVKNGLKTPEDANRQKNLETVLKQAGGPGQCATTQDCKAYCSDTTHLEECRAFAELHGFERVKNNIGSTTNAGMIIPPRKFEDGMGSGTMPRPPMDRPMGSSSNMYKPPMDGTLRPGMGSTTYPKPPMEGTYRPGSSTMPKPMTNLAPTTYPPKTGSTTTTYPPKPASMSTSTYEQYIQQYKQQQQNTTTPPPPPPPPPPTTNTNTSSYVPRTFLGAAVANVLGFFGL